MLKKSEVGSRKTEEKKDKGEKLEDRRTLYVPEIG